jgi:hypothetical protein
MNKKTIIIVSVIIFVIALVLFLFWDKIKERLHKNDAIEVMPPTNNTNNNVGGGVVVNTSAAPIITIAKKPKLYDVLKATETTYIFEKGTNNILKSFTNGSTVGIYTGDFDTPNYYYVKNGNISGMVKKTSVKPL